MSDDLIKRSDAIKTVDAFLGTDLIVERIKRLPSADRPSGTYTNSNYNVEWYAIEATCNLCGERWMGSTNFCPNCGADMRKESE